jgi:hypothetical protein
MLFLFKEAPMRIALIGGQIVLGLIFLAGLQGCNKAQAPDGDTATADHEHSHDEAGPHNGHIIELGADGYHAELTHDDAEHRVGIYILDGAAKAAAPIDAQSVTIRVSVADKPSEYELPAVTQPSDPEGKASYFELVSEELCKIVCGDVEEAENARVNITINGKPFVGIIETHHEHDHDRDHPHPHPHGEGEDHDHGHE